MNKRRVVITGTGIISPVGKDTKSNWQSITQGKSGIGPITQFDPSDLTCRIAGEIDGFDPASVVPANEVKRYDRYSLVTLHAADEAWSNANLSGHSYDTSKMGVILGVGIGGLYSLEQNLRAMIAGGPRKISPFMIPAMISNLAPGNVGIRFGLNGVNYTITSACTSGTHAIGEAARMISAGLQDVMITGGSEACITPLGVAGFNRMKALSTRNDEPQKASRPFDAGRDGFVMGEGSGILVLEALENAEKRGANILAEVTGYGFSCDAYHITAPHEEGLEAVSCMKMALDDAGIEPEQVHYINAHGTSTPINDPAETAAIRSVFGAHADNGLVVSSTKSMTGHLLGAAGGIEAVYLALAIANNVAPPTINLDTPGEGCNLDYVANVSRELTIDVAMSNSFGFGGTNSSIIFSKLS